MRIINGLRNVLNSNILFTIFFGILGLLSAAIALSSIRWYYGMDNQIQLYFAFLTDKLHLLPYRDFFSIQFPGAVLYYLIIVKIFGYSYFWFRIADLLCTVIILTVSFLLFKKISVKVAAAGVITFTLIYFIGGTYFSLQRDFVLLLPVLVSILFSYSFKNKFINTKSFICGFCCSIALLIKPHAVIVLPVLFIFNLINNQEENKKIFSVKRVVHSLFFCSIGLLIPIAVSILYLYLTNSLKSFWDIETNFTTMYRSSKMYLVPDPNMPVNNIISNNLIKLGGYRPFLLPAVFGFYISVFRSNLSKPQKYLIILFGSLSIFFILFVVIAGKFAPYHWIPFAFCIVFLSSTCFIQSDSINKFSSLFGVTALIVIFSITIFQLGKSQNRSFFRNELKGSSVENDVLNPMYPDIMKAAGYLKSNLNPGDKAVPLDDIGIGTHVMLLAKVEPGDYYLYEPILAFAEKEFPNSDYVHWLHKNYMESFNSNKPRFVIDFSGARHFDDLQQILNTYYTPIKFGHGVIYQKNKDY